MDLDQHDIQRLLTWWETIKEHGLEDNDEGEGDLVRRLYAHCEEAENIDTQ